MQITRLTLTHKNINEVIQLIKQTFLEFVAPDYDESGIKNFFKFAEDEELLKKLLFYAALHDDKITGILAVDDKVNHICLFFVVDCVVEPDDAHLLLVVLEVAAYGAQHNFAAC